MATNFITLNERLVEIEQSAFAYWLDVWHSYVDDQRSFVKDKANAGKNYTVDQFVMNWANGVGGAQNIPVTVGTIKVQMSRMNTWAEKFPKQKFTKMQDLRNAIDALNKGKAPTKPETKSVRLNHDAKFNAGVISKHLDGDKRAIKALIKALEAEIA